jgi:uncharacterized protein YbjT (DUF2867 family)
MIVVTGATGHLGRLVIAALLKKVPASGIVAAVLFDNGHQLSKLINRLRLHRPGDQRNAECGVRIIRNKDRRS